MFKVFIYWLSLQVDRKFMQWVILFYYSPHERKCQASHNQFGITFFMKRRFHKGAEPMFFLVF